MTSKIESIKLFALVILKSWGLYFLLFFTIIIYLIIPFVIIMLVLSYIACQTDNNYASIRFFNAIIYKEWWVFVVFAAGLIYAPILRVLWKATSRYFDKIYNAIADESQFPQ